MELKLLQLDSTSKSIFDSSEVSASTGRRSCSSSLKQLRRSCRCFPVTCSYSRRTTNNMDLSSGITGTSGFSSSYPINGRNGVRSSPYVNELRVLEAVDDEYGGVLVNANRLPLKRNAFTSALRSSLFHWKSTGKKGVWLKLPVELADFVPIAVKEGFEYHHAERGYVMLTYWIPEGPSLLPANASHQVGVGGFVINQHNEAWFTTYLVHGGFWSLKGLEFTVYIMYDMNLVYCWNQVLVVQETFCSPTCEGLWKLPTGFILESEEIYEGAVREVKEETGVDSEFVEVIAFRHAHNVAFEKSDLFFICMLRPISTQIMVEDHEIQAAKWMKLEEFMEQPLIQGDKMFKKIMDICIARLGRRYCGLNPHKVVSKFDGKESTLYYNVVEEEDCNSDSSSN
ncbi:hypothetical protein SAY86_027784 [Trapa natans]|uniref:Nudix hydrolase domain-containing protein n=1 Tax=Trapa natans TaxID=22666 RepID=A0AAN7KRE0_TRANT|nr:hypothetical protein SAY86_027784 [Trapa natans]